MTGKAPQPAASPFSLLEAFANDHLANLEPEVAASEIGSLFGADGREDIFPQMLNRDFDGAMVVMEVVETIIPKIEDGEDKDYLIGLVVGSVSKSVAGADPNTVRTPAIINLTRRAATIAELSSDDSYRAGRLLSLSGSLYKYAAGSTDWGYAMQAIGAAESHTGQALFIASGAEDLETTIEIANQIMVADAEFINIVNTNNSLNLPYGYAKQSLENARRIAAEAINKIPDPKEAAQQLAAIAIALFKSSIIMQKSGELYVSTNALSSNAHAASESARQTLLEKDEMSRAHKVDTRQRIAAAINMGLKLSEVLGRPDESHVDSHTLEIIGRELVLWYGVYADALETLNVDSIRNMAPGSNWANSAAIKLVQHGSKYAPKMSAMSLRISIEEDGASDLGRKENMLGALHYIAKFGQEEADGDKSFAYYSEADKILSKTDGPVMPHILEKIKRTNAGNFIDSILHRTKPMEKPYDVANRAFIEYCLDLLDQAENKLGLRAAVNTLIENLKDPVLAERAKSIYSRLGGEEFTEAQTQPTATARIAERILSGLMKPDSGE